MTPLPAHKTMIVRTVGPASAPVEALQPLLHSRMAIARLNGSAIHC